MHIRLSYCCIAAILTSCMTSLSTTGDTMENLTNRLPFPAFPVAGRAKALGAGILSAFDRLEAAIRLARANEARRPLHATDLRTLGLRDR
jgi:hypothetical protein